MAKPAVAELDKNGLTETYSYRGVEYTLREITGREYDDLERQATKPRTDPETGVTTEEVDEKMLRALMFNKALIKGKPEEGAGELPLRIRLNLMQRMNIMNFGFEEDEIAKAKAEAEERKKKGEVPPEEPAAGDAGEG